MFAFDKPFTWIIILLIVLLIFGAGRLPEIGKSLGRSIKEFKDETKNGMGEDNGTPVATSTTTNYSAPIAPATPSEPVVRRRIIKHPDGSEEIIEETVRQ
ncbi:MAG TPA: twin-arginine translocase TatA/TatE family subunit [Chloroflexia bacterium]|nr:twin-arginine translocase TatA/TatE family subunit [Chloroflexia bacterium]